MKPVTTLATLISVGFLTAITGCASSRNHEGTGQYIDDSVITTKVKAAILGDSSLKSSEINVETFKGQVQLSGFVNSREDIAKAAQVARNIDGVKAVTNKMELK